MIDRDDLTRQLSESLRANAEHITVPDERFDPERSGLALAVGAPPGRRPRARLAAAAAVVVVAVAGGVVALRSDPPADDAITDPGTGTSQESPTMAWPTPPTTDGVPVPAGAPDGLDLWGVTWWGPSPDATDPTRWAQLFGDPDDPAAALLVESQPAVPGGGGDGTPLLVRGHGATLLPAKDRPDDAWTVAWDEDGAALSASFRGMTGDEAVTALDALQPRSGAGSAGFDAPAGGSLELLDEVLDPVAPPVTGVFTYRDQPPAGNGPAGAVLEVRTAAATGSTTLAYLRTWFNGSRGTDGRATSQDTTGFLRVVTPDGLDVVGDPGGTAVPPEVVEQVVASVAPVPATDLTALWTEANGRVAALPLVATIPLASGTLELRGDAPALCLRLDVGPVCQTTRGSGDAVAIDGQVAASFQAGDAWYVAAASATGAPSLEPDDLDPEEGADGTWHGLLVRPDAGVDQVDVMFGDQGMGLSRP